MIQEKKLSIENDIVLTKYNPGKKLSIENDIVLTKWSRKKIKYWKRHCSNKMIQEKKLSIENDIVLTKYNPGKKLSFENDTSNKIQRGKTFDCTKDQNQKRNQI